MEGYEVNEARGIGLIGYVDVMVPGSATRRLMREKLGWKIWEGDDGSEKVAVAIAMDSEKLEKSLRRPRSLLVP